jgi:hypothetical protein
VAHHLRHHEGYADWRGAETHIHPLHPFFTALLGAAAGSLETRGRLVHCLASCLLLFPLALLAHRMSGAAGTRVALLLVAFHPQMILSSGWIQPEALYDLCVAGALLLLLAPESRRVSPWGWSGAGAMFGLSYLTRPEGLLVGTVAGTLAWLVLRRHEGVKLRSLSLFFLSLLLVSFPFLLFIHHVQGDWRITGKTTELFFLGQALQAGGREPFEGSSYLDLMERWKGLIPYALTHPGAVAATAASNALKIFGWILSKLLGLAGAAGDLPPLNRSRS